MNERRIKVIFRLPSFYEFRLSKSIPQFNLGERSKVINEITLNNLIIIYQIHYPFHIIIVIDYPIIGY